MMQQMPPSQKFSINERNQANAIIFKHIKWFKDFQTITNKSKRGKRRTVESEKGYDGIFKIIGTFDIRVGNIWLWEKNVRILMRNNIIIQWDK